MSARFVLVISLVTLFFSSSASARSIAVRPAMQAEMVELDRDGKPVLSLYKYELVLNKAGEKPISFTLIEIFGSKCPPGAMCILPYIETRRDFRIAGRSMAGCGSMKYSAVSSDRKSARMTLLDHTTRLCDDFQPYAWVAQVQDSRGKVKRLVGNPKPIQGKDCSEIAKNTICTMQYAPSTCVAESFDGDKLKEPLVAEGGNPCFAAANLKVAACERGLDAERLRDEEIFCGPTLKICPLPMCAAPPIGCRYIPDGDLNVDGCPNGCGKLVCDDPIGRH